MRFPYKAGDTRSAAPGAKVVDCRRARSTTTGQKTSSPARWSRLYVTVGSNSNVGENGIENEVDAPRSWRWIRDRRPRLFASGLRNPTGWIGNPNRRALDCGERTGRAWQRPRARLHDRGAGRRLLRLAVQLLRHHVDTRAQPQRPDLVARAIVPTTRSAPIPRHSGWRSIGAVSCRSAIPAGRSSVSRLVEPQPCSGYKVYSYRSPTDAPTGIPRMCLLISSMRGPCSRSPRGRGGGPGRCTARRGRLGNEIWRVRPDAPGRRRGWQ